MSNYNLSIDLQTSTTYLLIIITIYCLCLFATWYYTPELWMQIGLSGMLSFWLYNLMSKNILNHHPSAIRQVIFTKTHINIIKNDQSSQQYPNCKPIYQSAFLIIFELEKQPLLIFKDGTKHRSLSAINRLLKEVSYA